MTLDKPYLPSSKALFSFISTAAQHSLAKARGYQITRTADGKAIGGIGFKGQPIDGCVEVGYGLVPSARGNGYDR
jgi:RimJ/RimL family protein N-acetyltransferase